MLVTIYINKIPHYFDIKEINIDLCDYKIITISNNIQKFIILKYFNLQNNYLKKLPSSCFKCINLERLYLDNNYFKRIPVAIFKLSKLQSIDFANNKIKSLSNIYKNTKII